MTIKGLAGKCRRRNILLVLLSVVMFGGCLLGAFMFSGQDEGEPYTRKSKEEERVYIDVQYASEAFAYFNIKASDQMFFMMDKNQTVYIVCMAEEDISAYEKIQAYTFGETYMRPDPIRTDGKLARIDEALMNMAITEFNTFWGREVVTDENAYEFFGKYYIDATEKEIPAVMIVFLALSALWIFVLVIVLKDGGKQELQTHETRLWLIGRGDQARVEKQLQDGDKIAYKMIGAYLTEEYLVSWKGGLSVIELAGITGIYGVVTTRSFELIVLDKERKETMAVLTPGKTRKHWQELIALITEWTERIPGLLYGKDQLCHEGPFDITQMPYFFTSKMSAPTLEMQKKTEKTDETVKGPHYVAGVLLAIAGALVGGALWFFIGWLGYIGGIAGVAILLLAAKGFVKGAKVMTKAGAVIVVVISVVMIFFSNYVLYAWLFVDGTKGRFTLWEAMLRLPSVMREYEMIGGFVKELLIGYVLSLIAGFSTLKKMFGKM